MSRIVSILRQWRDQQARIEGVEGFRVLPNTTLEAVAGTLPRTKEALLAIKGIKEAKCRKYGAALLRIVEEQTSGTIIAPQVPSYETAVSSGQEHGDETLSVSQFLDGLNTELSGMAARIRGEVSSVDLRERVVYFTIKDAKDESTLSCLMFRSRYDVSGVELVVGDEIVIEGVPEVYKPNGRLSLKVGVIEPFGEGALKKAYDALKSKLEKEGLFLSERKRTLPRFPERIALITSEQGAAIGDFTMNLGAQGLKVYFYPTSVEGKKAVFEIIKGIRFFNRHPERYDVLVIVRGGGSLESLQAFNNEALTREVAASHIPTLLGIGHEKDVTLAAQVADANVSTPTATARILKHPFDEARQLTEHFRRQLPILFRERLADTRRILSSQGETLLAELHVFREMERTLRQDIAERLVLMQSSVREHFSGLENGKTALFLGFRRMRENVVQTLIHLEERLFQYDPKQVLRLGYGLLRKSGKVVKDVSETAIGDILDVELCRGKLRAKVEDIEY